MAAARWSSAAAQPFFLGVGLRSVHIPYHYPPAYADLYPEAGSFAVAAHPVMDASQPLIGWYDQAMGSINQGIGTYGDVHRSGDLSEQRPMNRSEQQRVRRNYYAATSYSDAQLGRLLDGLDKHGVANHTLVVCFGDHGQALGEHNLWEKMSVFEARPVPRPFRASVCAAPTLNATGQAYGPLCRCGKSN